MRNVLKRRWTYAVASILFGSIASAAIAADTAQDTASLRKIEEGLKLPPGAAPLGSYNRYYAYAMRDGRKILIGVFIDSGAFPSEGKHPPSAHIVKNEADLPRILDGGCSVLNVIVDPLAPQDAQVHCNGVA